MTESTPLAPSKSEHQLDRDFLAIFNIDPELIFNYVISTPFGNLIANYTCVDGLSYSTTAKYDATGKLILGLNKYNIVDSVNAFEDKIKALIMLRIARKFTQTLITINYCPLTENGDPNFEHGALGLFKSQNIILPVNILDIQAKKTSNKDTALVEKIRNVEKAEDPESLIKAIDDYVDACFELQSKESLK